VTRYAHNFLGQTKSFTDFHGKVTDHAYYGTDSTRLAPDGSSATRPPIRGRNQDQSTACHERPIQMGLRAEPCFKGSALARRMGGRDAVEPSVLRVDLDGLALAWRAG